ncbi:MAG: TetR/AcrR family transcriptional regulator [Pseudomonadota bacterium]
MPRPAGVRNRDFDEKRAALLETLTDFALNADLRRPSLRQFAIAAGASEPTLRHYFTDRRGLVLAILETIGGRGEAIWTIVAVPSSDPASAVEEYYRVSEAGMRHRGFIRAHAFGLIEGLADAEIGKAYLQFVLEPALGAVSRKLASTPGGPKSPAALRAAAFSTLSPLLVLSLHQDLLGGQQDAAVESGDVIAAMQGLLGAGLVASDA